MAAGENIKGITIQIGGDVEPLNKALEQATNKAQFLQKELQSINEALKLDPNNVELLKKKFNVLGKSIEEAELNVGDLQKKWDQAKEDFKAGKISQTEFDRITQELNSGKKELETFKGQLETTKKKLEELGYTVTDTGDIIEDTSKKTKDASKSTEDLGETAKKTGEEIKKTGEKTKETGDKMGKLSIESIAAAAAGVKLAEKIVTMAIELRKYINAQDELISSNDALLKSIDKTKDKYKEETRDIETNNVSLEIQLNRIRQLDRGLKDENTTEENAQRIKSQLKNAVDQFNKSAGESVFTINDETGALNENITAGTNYIRNLKERAKYQANYNRLIEIYTEITLLEGKNQLFAAKATNQHTDKYSKMIDKNNLLIRGLQEEAANLEGVVTNYLEYTQATEQAEESIEELTAAEAEHLYRAQADGQTLSELQQQQLAQYRETHAEEINILEETVQKEAELLDRRVDKASETDSKIELNTKTSLKKRAKTIEHNTKMVNNYEKNLHDLLLIALAQDDEDAKQAMLNYLNTLTDYTTDSMTIVQQMVDDFGKTGGKTAWELINGFKAANTKGEWSNAGVEIGKAAGKGVATGIEQSKPLVTNAATQLARAIERQLEGVKVTYKINPVTGIQRNGITIQAMAQGGIVTQPTFTLTGEAGPEAIVPLDKLGGIIESALGNSGGIGGGYTMNVYPQSMSPSEQEMLLDKFDRRFGDRTSRRAI